MNRPTIALATLCLTLGATTIAAQGFARGGQAPSGAAPGPLGPNGPGFSPGAIAETLGLTAEQREGIQALREDLRTRAEPLAQEIRALHDEIRLEIEHGADPTTVGERVIAIFALKAELEAMREAHETELEALLSPEQVAKLELIRELGDAEARHPFGPGARGDEAALRAPRPPF